MWYDVRYRVPKRTDFFLQTNEEKFVLAYVKVPARSAAEALDYFGDHHAIMGVTIMDISQKPKVFPLEHEWDTRDRTYWHGKWHDALAAMPYKIIQSYDIDWVPQPKGETPLPTFIKGRAKGKMRMIGNQVHVMVKSVHSTYEAGRASALGILLGYVTWTGADHKRRRANSCAMLGRKIPESSRPRDAKARELLSKLGDIDRFEIKRMLAEKRKQMKRMNAR